jgi:chromosome partitioning protein
MSVIRTIAVLARKGGSGKTTLAVHLAIAAHLRGRKAVLADTDPQRSAGAVLEARNSPGPLYVQTTELKLFALRNSAQRAGADALIVDTAAGSEHCLGPTLALADLSLLVVRPAFLDVAAAARTMDEVRCLGRSALLVLNQAPVPRNGVRPESVEKALEALRFAGMPVAPVVIRSRAIFQTVLASGRSVEEVGPSPAAEEIAALWRYIDQVTAASIGPSELAHARPALRA